MTWSNIPPLPLTFDMLKTLMTGVGIHESGHMLGLVDEGFLGGIEGSHNPDDDPLYIMNNGQWTRFDWRFEIHGTRQFNTNNTEYLKWLLPKP